MKRKFTAFRFLSIMKLERCRRQIDLIDAEIVALLAAREGLSREIGRVKAAAGLPIVDAKRESEVQHTVNGLSEQSKGIASIYREILEQSRRVQAEVSDEKLAAAMR
jgi:chorismate mutase